jgi:Uma2 family endonuclease
MFAMSGGTRWHSLISSNLIREMSSALKGRRCLVYDSNLRVKVEATGLMTYPDVIVACKEQRFVDNEMDTLLNPTLLLEVLSESTESYDRGKKFENYRQIPALEEYLLVSQTEPKVEQYIRQNSGEWLLRFHSGLDCQIELPSLGISIQLSEVFANVTFEAVTLRNPTPSRNSAQQSSAGN